MEKLTLAETKEHLLAWRELKDEKSFVLLINSNKALIHHITKKYLNSNIDYNDLVSAGKEGLIKGINKFDYKNWEISKFSSYISIAIENQIRLELRHNNGHSCSVSLYSAYISNKDGESLTYLEKLDNGYNLQEDIVINSIAETIKECLNDLTPVQREVICLRFGIYDGDFKTLEEVGKILNKSRQATSVNEQMGLDCLRKKPIIKSLKL